MATWRDLLTKALEAHGESPDDIEATTLTDRDLDAEWDNGYVNGGEGVPFTVWTKARVYFPARSYDGEESVESVARHPDGKRTLHIGDG